MSLSSIGSLSALTFTHTHKIANIEQIQLAKEYADLTHVISKGDGPVTFLLDGGPGIAHYLWNFFETLDMPGRLIGFDSLGTGLTKAPINLDPNPEALALQFSGLILKYTKPNQPIKIIAHSFGAVVLRLALDQVFKWNSYDITLLLIDPCPFTAHGALEAYTNIEQMFKENGDAKKASALQEQYIKALTENDQENIHLLEAELVLLIVKTPLITF
jgi:hypothetical protein